jgi:prephenate dehydrogenase
MPIKITIIGLGQIGTSIGLALAKIKDQATRVGNDREISIARKAEKLGALDKVAFNLPNAVKDADLVILAVPVSEIRETIGYIAEDLKPGSVLIDTSLVKTAVMEWAKELLPGPDRYFVALTPSLNPAYLLEAGETVDQAHADLFQNSLMLITTLPGIDESALNLASQLVQILGALPLYTDSAETDGLTAYTHVLPRLLASALVNVTMEQSGWREARKMAGHAYAQATEPAIHEDAGKSLAETALLNAENTTRVLDLMIDELQQVREAIISKDTEALQERLDAARTAREQWLHQRFSARWEDRVGKDVALPTGGDVVGRLFGFRPKKDKNR